MKQIRKRLTYANVMSSIAVFLVVGGATAFAAGHLGKNTVGAKQLKKNAVTTAKVKDGSLLSTDFKAGQIPAGPRGLTGLPGPAGKDAFGALVYKSAEAENLSGDQSFVEASCDSGEHVVGGGVWGSLGSLGQNVNSSFPSNGDGEGDSGNTAWAGYVNNESGVSGTIVAFAICAKAGSVSGPPALP